MSLFYTIFTTRELATFFWVAIFLLWVLTKKEVRGSIWVFLKSVARLWKFFFLHFLYISLIFVILYETITWNTHLTKITIYWIFGWSLISFANSAMIHRKKGYLVKIFREILNVTVLITFIVNFYTFPILVELFLVPFVFLVITLTAVAEMKDEHKEASVFLNYTQIIFGFGILSFSLYQVLVNIQTFASYTTLLEFLLPIILSLMLLPFLYGMSLYGEFEQKRVRKKFLNKKNVSLKI